MIRLGKGEERSEIIPIGKSVVMDHRLHRSARGELTRGVNEKHDACS